MTICVFGDSIAWGAYDPEQGGWVNRLRNFLQAEDEDSEVYNLGVPGDTTFDLLERVESEAISRKPDTIIFAIGINDAQFIFAGEHKDTYFNEFKANVANLYEIAKKFTPKIIFIGLTSVDEEKMKVQGGVDGVYTNEKIESLDKIIKNFCQKMGLKYIPMYDLLNNSDLIDGLHPNTIGHVKMFDRVLGAMKV